MPYILTLITYSILFFSGMVWGYNLYYAAFLYVAQLFLISLGWTFSYFVYRLKSRFKSEGFIVSEGHGLRKEAVFLVLVWALLALTLKDVLPIVLLDIKDPTLVIAVILMSTGYVFEFIQLTLNSNSNYLCSELLIGKYHGLTKLILLLVWLPLILSGVFDESTSKFYFTLSMIVLAAIELFIIWATRKSARQYEILSDYPDTYIDYSKGTLSSSLNRWVNLEDYPAKSR